MRREGLQARGIYKEVPRPSRRLALATRQKIPYTPSRLLALGNFFLGTLSQAKIGVCKTCVSRNFGDLRQFAAICSNLL
jgi:hypothetical protein